MNILITGATSGIGLATALAFAKEGHHILLGHRYKDAEFQTACDALQDFAGGYTPVLVDIADLESITTMQHHLVKEKLRVDVLVNCAGVFEDTGFMESTPALWDKIINTNLRGTYFMTQAVAALMLKQKSGVIINVSSVAGVYPRKDHLEYAISKAGIIHMTRCLAQALAPLRVNAVAPSYTWSKFLSFMRDKKKVARKMESIPLGRFNEAEDVAESILFLASEKARNITGEVLVIDGGRAGRI